MWLVMWTCLALHQGVLRYGIVSFVYMKARMACLQPFQGNHFDSCHLRQIMEEALECIFKRSLKSETCLKLSAVPL